MIVNKMDVEESNSPVKTEPTIAVRQAVKEDIPILIDMARRMAKETEDKDLDPAKVTPGVAGIFDKPKYGYYLVGYKVSEPEKLLSTLMVTFEMSADLGGIIYWI